MADSSPTEICWFKEEKLDYFSVILFLALHLACLLALWTGASWVSIITCVVLYILRMFGITAGFHRYFAHRTYKTSRFFQFVLAFIGGMALQKGVLWWAAHHRYHHAFSDSEKDVHSPLKRGFWWSHCGWFLCHRNNKTNIKIIQNLMKYRELRFLNDYYLFPPALLALSMFLLGTVIERYVPQSGTSGAQMLVWGFFISTVLLFHGTFTVNSVTHVFGTRRFHTKDNSRNNFLIALITLGEGWHNNHHYLPSSERHGFYWWEIDIAHYILRYLSWARIVWDIQTPSRGAYKQLRRPAARRAWPMGRAEAGVDQQV